MCINSIFIDQNKFILDLPLLFALPLYSFLGAAIPPSPKKRLIQAGERDGSVVRGEHCPRAVVEL